MSGTAQNLCPTCGDPIAADAPFGQCPRCLFGFASGTGLDRGLPGDDWIGGGEKRHFAGYELIEEIARGGMGIVYRARQLKLGREVALKMLSSGDLASPEAVQRFHNEASAAASLDHPNIVPVYEIGEEETGHYFTMRLVPGGRNIADWARDLPPEGRPRRIAAMMARVARALSYAHDHGVLHRDLKPSNLLIDEDDEPQVTDFGLARLYREADSGLTLTRQILGSPSYMAPEQAEGRRADETTLTDVYGLGAVLYEMLSGRPPFLAESPIATARKVVEEMPARLPDVPRDLETICLKCLEKESARRYHSALDLAGDLERFARGEPIRARPLTGAEALWRWARRRPKLAALSGSFLVTLLAGFAIVLWQWNRAELANAGLKASVERLEWRRTVQLLDGGDFSVGMAQLATMLREDPGNARAASLAISTLEQGGFAVPAAPALSHGGTSIIRDAKLSPDGSRIVTAGSDGTARLWEAGTSRPLGEPMRHEGPVRRVEFSPDGRIVATASDDGTARLWDAENGAALSPPLRHEGPVVGVKFGPGPLVATISQDGIARIWRDGEAVAKLPLGGAGKALVWSIDGGALFTASTAGMQGWSLDGAQLFADEGSFDGLALSPDGTRLAGFSERQVRIWETSTGAALTVKLADTAGLLDLVWSPDGTKLAGAAGNSWARIWEAETGRALTPKLPHLYACECVAFSPDGKELLSGGDDGVARRWEVATGRRSGGNINHREAVLAARFSAAGDRLLLVAHPWNDRSSPRGGTAQLWDLHRRGAQPMRYRHPGSPTVGAVAWSPDGRVWVSHAVGGECALHEPGKDSVVLPDSRIQGWARGLAFLPDGKRLLVVSTTGEFSLWSVPEQKRLFGPIALGTVEGVCLFPDGEKVVVGLLSGEVAIRKVSDATVIRPLPTHRAPLNCVEVSPDGALVATAGEDGQCFVSDAATGEPLFPPIHADDEFVSVQFSPDSRWIVTASHDRTARVWDARSGKARGSVMWHDGEVAYAQFSPDGRRVLSADRSGAARIWSAETGGPLVDPMRHGTALRHARFSPDGSRLVTEDHTGLRFWETASGEPLTLTQPHPTSIGIGFFSRGQHTAFSPGGDSVIQGIAVPEAIRWDFPPPPVPAPGWLPDLLEAIAGLRIVGENAIEPVPLSRWLEIRKRLGQVAGGDFYARWAHNYAEEGE